ncbi:hypothetical protein [Thermoflavimicrobium daqui]|jgi:hypothetical protein|uniref:Sporulation membrane protein YtrI C-terminal domain-containing protein n=1 Tax=Thermoflavimicrobium daqui TaxID=2137476 RepID=A0A364K976_9BACL|nr:hypothetical protein [Thermoflavimicrobium daqui]RAL26847.1 hypothetical protein DL897_02015 [Thermoflavimicrobium daqui]
MFRQAKKHRYSFTIFLFGMITGASLFLFLYSQKIDSLYLERDAIYFANNQKYKRILKLEQEITKLSQQKSPQTAHQPETIKKIIVEVDSEQRFGTEMIKAQVESLLEPFLDKSMDWVSNNPQLVESVLLKKPIPIDEESSQTVQVYVKYLSFHQQTLKIWVSTEEVSNNNMTIPQK